MDAENTPPASGITIRRRNGKSRYNQHAHDSGDKWNNGAKLVDTRLSATRNNAISKRVSTVVRGKHVSLRGKFHTNVQLA